MSITTLVDKKLVFVAMSGGVDSSVAAALIKKAGFETIGVFMKNWSRSDFSPKCSSEEDAEDARRVAEVLKIPFYVFNFENDYKEKIIDPMIEGYKNGLTPNPDIVCNKEIKFGLFLKKALSLGALACRQAGIYIATGHYARKISAEGQEKILKAKDENKDQSYFLYQLNQEQLSRALFPIGDYLKSEVRELAKKFKLPTAGKKDSQGLCFVGKIKMSDFLGTKILQKEGEIISTSGQMIGRHRGAAFYTLGQRTGLGIGGSGPYFVVSRDTKENRLVVARENDPSLFAKSIFLDKIHWMSGQEPILPLKYSARIRYRQPLQDAIINKTEKRFIVQFNEPQWAPAPGQHCVFYSGDEMLGGGQIV
ncbi:MAG: tRNA 2-thiouridine(34) synthase MnmA [Parcubacteria group bacterium]|nr:tRNA 2-thiouridine(34) synthase MnmA [Parcubacteria group bacterium]